MIDWLKHEWVNLASKYIEDKSVVEEFWLEIQIKYSAKNRYYHNLSHVHNMLLHAKKVKKHIQDYDVLRFAIWYHDIIYKSTKNDNEEKSAVLAEKRLKLFKINENRLKTIKNLIISTKNHQLIISENSDNAYLLDIDLCILGANWRNYINYTKQIRKEYLIYPDFLYKKGRRKVLTNLLERETLYFTKIYRNLFENQARKNIKKELEFL